MANITTVAMLLVSTAAVNCNTFDVHPQSAAMYGKTGFDHVNLNFCFWVIDKADTYRMFPIFVELYQHENKSSCECTVVIINTLSKIKSFNDIEKEIV